MDDLHGGPSGRDREQLEERIRRVADEGRISEADRDIRLGNVRSAASRAELDLMSRDLDQLEASVVASAPGVTAPVGAAGAATPAPYSRFDPQDVPTVEGPTVVVTGSRRALSVVVLVAVVAVVVGAIIAFIAFVGHRVSSTPPTALPPAQTDDASPSGGASSGSSTGPDVAGGYALSVPGIRGFLATYAHKFGTTRVVDLVLYPDYAVVDVPVQGGRGRQAGWVYRNDSGWTSFGGVRAVFPGSSTVDTRQLDVPALVRNIARAPATLKVESPSQTYVVIRFIPRIEQVPSVDIHVANDFQESGYLATTLDGKVERAYPYGD